MFGPLFEGRLPAWPLDHRSPVVAGALVISTIGPGVRALVSLLRALLLGCGDRRRVAEPLTFASSPALCGLSVASLWPLCGLFVASLWPLCGIASRPGNAILREIVVQHPAAKSMLEIARTQDEETGDGASMARPPPTLNPARPRPRLPCHQPRRTSRPCCAALAAQVADGTAPRHRPRQH